MSNVPQSSALARVELPDAPLERVDELKATLARLKESANLISPVCSVDFIPAMHGVSLRAVVIDSTINKFGQGGEVYRDRRFCEANERALGGVALRKILAAAGVQVVARRRLDNQKDPAYCNIEMVLACRDFDGQFRQFIGSRETDLRAGAPETMKPEKVKGPGDQYAQPTGRQVPLTDSALAEKRLHIQSNTETKATFRALRGLLALKQKYSVEELGRPFVVPKLVAALDPSDPDQKRALIAQATAGDAVLFGVQSQQVQDAKEIVDVTPEPPPTVVTEPEAPKRNEEPKEIDDDADALGDVDLTVEAEPIVCLCPCGDQSEVGPAVAEKGMERHGTVRCRDCWPGKTFKFGAGHPLEMDLQLPKSPGVTVLQLQAALQKAKK